MRIAFILFLVCVLGLISAPARAQDMTPPDDPRFAPLSLAGSGPVDQVIDPLTLRLQDGTLVRLMGLDVPGDRRVPVDELAMAARASLDKLTKGKPIVLYQPRKMASRTDRYGRLLAFAVLREGNVWLQDHLVARGFARVWDGAATGADFSPLLVAEEKARQQGLGLWAAGSPDRLFSPETLPVTALGNPAVLSGRVIRTEMEGNDIHLRLGSNPAGRPDDLTLRIPAALRPDLSRARLSPLSWKGELLRVRGIVQADASGPYLVVEDLWQMEPIRTALFPDLELGRPTGGAD